MVSFLLLIMGALKFWAELLFSTLSSRDSTQPTPDVVVTAEMFSMASQKSLIIPRQAESHLSFSKHPWEICVYDTLSFLY
jgi:hypothetical protein